MPNAVKIRVPGTTANCGPGFDTVGMACTIYNELQLSLSVEGKVLIEVSGEGRGIIPEDERNIALQAVKGVLEKIGQPYQGIHLKMNNCIPLARGLGSSAAAIVAGLFAANAATGNTLTKDEILNMATAIEGHPDNVAPAIFGGITVSVMQGTNAECLRFVPPKKLMMVVAVPEFTLSTKTARQVLPAMVPRKDAVFNISRVALLVGALCKGEFQYLQCAFSDRIHQPYREKLIPGMQDVFQSAVNSGALGAAISGAGPCLIAFTEQKEDIIGGAMVAAFAKNNIKAHYMVLNIDLDGAKII